MRGESEPAARALAVLPTDDLAADLAWFADTLGFRLERIAPADDPRVAELSGHGLRLRLDRTLGGGPGTLCLRTPEATSPAGDEAPPPALVSPGGTRVLRERETTRVVVPPTRHRLEVRRLADDAPWIIGRAGMHYRDLIPSRLGGSVIASHIRVPDDGPVPDRVHYHAVGFQLIHCVRGRVRLVYEDQGEPFWLEAGDSVTQPPRIRHRVLEAADALEVVEIGVPAEHLTTIDHDMMLPTRTFRPERRFDGQRFCRSRRAEARWTRHAIDGLERRDTGVADASGGVASVSVVRPRAGASTASGERGAAVGGDVTRRVSHDADILFGFVLAGGLALDGRALVAGDAFTLPPGETFEIGFATRPAAGEEDGKGDGLEWLEVALPGSARFAETKKGRP